MHVDGFRFDLAATLARELHDVDRLSAFFDLIQQDPVVSQVKLIAEPWDVGEGGYQVGQLPAAVVGVERQVPRRGPRLLARRRAHRGRVRLPLHRARATSTRPTAAARRRSINFVTAHDGFTLADLVSYNDKHNEANGEDNRDGTDDNRSWNCGVEGPTDDPSRSTPCAAASSATSSPRCCSRRACRCCSAATRSAAPSGGNNNAYCQDNEISWFDWEAVDDDLLDFTRQLIALRRGPPGVPPPPLVPGPAHQGRARRRHRLVHARGRPMSDEDWQTGFATAPSASSSTARPSRARGPRGERVVDDSFFVVFNASDGDEEFHLPDETYGTAWSVRLDTGPDDTVVAFPRKGERIYTAGTPVSVTARSTVVLQRLED